MRRAEKTEGKGGSENCRIEWVPGISLRGCRCGAAAFRHSSGSALGLADGSQQEERTGGGGGPKVISRRGKNKYINKRMNKNPRT